VSFLVVEHQGILICYLIARTPVISHDVFLMVSILIAIILKE
jgi:hypothetical protein